MIINRLNQLYKPKRTLYYMDASKEDILSYSKPIPLGEYEEKYL